MAVGNGHARGHHSRPTAIVESRRMFPKHQAGENVPRMEQQKEPTAIERFVLAENDIGWISRQAINADAFEEKQSR